MDRDPDRPERDDELTARIVDLLRAAAGGAWTAGRWSATSIVEGVDQAVSPLVARRVRTAMGRGSVGASRRDVSRALRSARDRSVPGSAARVALPRVARRLAPVRAMTRRSPVGMALWLGPGLVEVVSTGLAEIDVVSSHLGARARQAGVTPAVEPVHAITVSVLGGRSPRPDGDHTVDHRPLLRTWVRSAAGSVVPFGLVDGSHDIDGICDRLDTVADHWLGGGPRGIARG